MKRIELNKNVFPKNQFEDTVNIQFTELVSHIAEALKARSVFLFQTTSEGFKVLASSDDRIVKTQQNFPYSLASCNLKLKENSKEQYFDPQNNGLFTEMNVKHYLGAPLQNTKGEQIGSLCIFYDNDFSDQQWNQTLIRIFATRAGAELERYLTAKALENLNEELEMRIR